MSSARRCDKHIRLSYKGLRLNGTTRTNFHKSDIFTKKGTENRKITQHARVLAILLQNSGRITFNLPCNYNCENRSISTPENVVHLTAVTISKQKRVVLVYFKSRSVPRVTTLASCGSPKSNCISKRSFGA